MMILNIHISDLSSDTCYKKCLSAVLLSVSPSSSSSYSDLHFNREQDSQHQLLMLVDMFEVNYLTL